MLVGLKDADQSLRPLSSTQGAQSRVDLGGVVAVIVVHDDLPIGDRPGAQVLHAPIAGVLASALAVFVAIYSSISTNLYVGSACYLLLTLPLALMLPRAEHTS